MHRRSLSGACIHYFNPILRVASEGLAGCSAGMATGRAAAAVETTPDPSMHNTSTPIWSESVAPNGHQLLSAAGT
jgi:hypothetical protein